MEVYYSLSNLIFWQVVLDNFSPLNFYMYKKSMVPKKGELNFEIGANKLVMEIISTYHNTALHNSMYLSRTAENLFDRWPL